MALDPGTVLKRGFTRRCPVCGDGGIFRRWLWMADDCPRCAFRFKRVPGHWLGSWFLNLCVTQGVVVLIILAFGAIAWPDVPVVPMTIAAGAAAVAVPLLFFPWSRTIWVAVELAMRPLELDEGVAPGFELEADIAELRAGSGRDGAGHPHR